MCAVRRPSRMAAAALFRQEHNRQRRGSQGPVEKTTWELARGLIVPQQVEACCAPWCAVLVGGGSGAACRRSTTSPGRSGSRSSSIPQRKVCARPRARQGVQGVVVRGRGLHLAGLRVGGRRTPAPPLSGEAESAIIAGHSGARDEMASCGGARKAFYTRSARLGRWVTQYPNWPLA